MWNLSLRLKESLGPKMFGDSCVNRRSERIRERRWGGGENEMSNYAEKEPWRQNSHDEFQLPVLLLYGVKHTLCVVCVDVFLFSFSSKPRTPRNVQSVISPDKTSLLTITRPCYGRARLYERVSGSRRLMT